MGKTAATILILCALLAIPVLGDWVRDGPYADVSDPFYYQGPDNSWACGWNGWGVVEGNDYYLHAYGETWGEAWVQLVTWPYPYQPDGLDRGAWAGSKIHGWTNYARADGNDTLDVQVTIEILDAELAFYGDAWNAGTCPARSSSYCWAMGQGSLIWPNGTFWEDGAGLGLGVGSSESGTYALTYAENVTPYGDYEYYYQGTNWGTFGGYLNFTATIAPAPWSTTPTVDSITVDSVVSGIAAAEGHLANYSYGDFDADANYYVHGSCEAKISGNIR